MPRLVRKDDPAIEIMGTSDYILATAYISNPRLEDGKLVFDWADESDVDWDSQTTRLDIYSGGRMFVDQNNQLVAEQDVVLLNG